LFSILLAPLLYHIVHRTEESKLWAERSEQKETEEMIRQSEKSDRPAVVDLLSSPFRRRQLIGMIGFLSSCSSSFYTLFLWTPVYLSELRGILREQDADFMNFIVVACYIFFLLVAGKLSDKFPHRMDLMRIGLPGIIVGAPAMFGMFESESLLGCLLAQIMMAFCLAMVEGNKAAWEVELWMADPTLSFTGVAIGHNIAATLFGGTMPLVATFLYYRSYSFQNEEQDVLWARMIPGFYISILGCVALYSVTFVVRHPHDVRISGSKLKEAVERENRKYKAIRNKKKKMRQQLETQLHNNGDSYNMMDENFSPR
jgi:MFS family permease